jgi:hypothetical protein
MTDYAQGFKDGFAAGLEEGKKLLEEKWRLDKIAELEKTLPKPQPRLDDYVFGARETCPKCHMKIDRVMGYVCASPNCPTFPQVTYGVPMTGAVGSTNIPEYPMGAVGPTGPMHNGPEYQNKIWINGQWVELGN